MPLEIHEEPKKDRIVTMGQADKPVEPVADYYPPGATEPIVRPAHIPAPEPKPESAREPEVKEEVKEELKAEVKAEAKAEKPRLSNPLKKTEANAAKESKDGSL